MREGITGPRRTSAEVTGPPRIYGTAGHRLGDGRHDGSGAAGEEAESVLQPPAATEDPDGGESRRAHGREEPRMAMDARRGNRTAVLELRALRADARAHGVSQHAGDRRAARGQGARAGVHQLLHDPAALEHHHRAVDVFSREGSRAARVRAGELADALRREAHRVDAALELDDRADGRADFRGVRNGCIAAGCSFRSSRSRRSFPF